MRYMFLFYVDVIKSVRAWKRTKRAFIHSVCRVTVQNHLRSSL